MMTLSQMRTREKEIENRKSIKLSLGCQRDRTLYPIWRV